MNQSSHSQPTLALLQNVQLFSQLVVKLNDRDNGVPGMGCFYGPSGFGKSTATIFAQLHYDAVVVEMKSVWTKKFLCEKICEELFIDPARTIPMIVEQIGEALMETGRPLIIDEADFLMKGSNIEIARDIYRSSEVPVILVGEERLPSKLALHERVHGRILDWVAAQPADKRDFDELKKIRCAGAELSTDLENAILKASNGSARRIVTNLDYAAHLVKLHRLDVVTREDWGDAPFHTGEIPSFRKF